MQIEHVRGITYGQAGSLALQMDIARPVGASNLPGVILVHGCGWFEGKRTDQDDDAQKIAENGYVAFTVSYRLTSQPHEFNDPYAVGAPYPAAPDDVHAAVDHIMSNAAGYGVDASRVAMFGTSAGGQLALLTAYTDQRISAVVGWFAPTAMAKLYYTSAQRDRVGLYLGTPSRANREDYYEASPLSHAGPACPSTLIIQGTADETVPVAQAQLLEQALAPLPVFSRFIYIPGGTHALPGHRREAMNDSIDFLDAAL